MSVRANPLDNLSKPMAKAVGHLQSGKIFRVDKSISPWAVHCSNFREKSQSMGGRFKIGYQTFAGLHARCLLDLAWIDDKGRLYYRLRKQFLVAK